jgi:hypothetical protein
MKPNKRRKTELKLRPRRVRSRLHRHPSHLVLALSPSPPRSPASEPRAQPLHVRHWPMRLRPCRGSGAWAARHLASDRHRGLAAGAGAGRRCSRVDHAPASRAEPRLAKAPAAPHRPGRRRLALPPGSCPSVRPQAERRGRSGRGCGRRRGRWRRARGQSWSVASSLVHLARVGPGLEGRWQPDTEVA